MLSKVTQTLTHEEKLFLQMVHNPINRSRLLDRLEKLGLLSVFLEAENGTKTE